MAYMPQHVFTSCALMVAMAELAGTDSADVARQLATKYRRSYRDQNFLDDVLEASAAIVNAMPSLLPDVIDANEARAACKAVARAPGARADAIRRQSNPSRRRSSRAATGSMNRLLRRPALSWGPLDGHIVDAYRARTGLT